MAVRTLPLWLAVNQRVLLPHKAEAWARLSVAKCLQVLMTQPSHWALEKSACLSKRNTVTTSSAQTLLLLYKPTPSRTTS